MSLPITWIGSPNKTTGRKGYTPIGVVIHIMDGTLLGTDSWFGNPRSQVSAHYGIGQNGEIHQYVQEQDCAWHAGRVDHPTCSFLKSAGAGIYINPNYYTIGIEHEGNNTSDWSDVMKQSSGKLIAEICQRNNIP